MSTEMRLELKELLIGPIVVSTYRESFSQLDLKVK